MLGTLRTVLASSPLVSRRLAALATSSTALPRGGSTREDVSPPCHRNQSSGGAIRSVHIGASNGQTIATASTSKPAATAGGTSSSTHFVIPNAFPGADELAAFKLAHLKVFHDEQIIQLSFQSGLAVNFQMSVLRNQCACGSVCRWIRSDTPLSVARFRSTETELEIEWIDPDYKNHVSVYNLRDLASYAV